MNSGVWGKMSDGCMNNESEENCVGYLASSLRYVDNGLESKRLLEKFVIITHSTFHTSFIR